MARRQSRQFNRSSSRPNRGWSGLIETTFTLVAPNSRVLLSLGAPNNPGIDLTVLRTVGGLFVTSDQTAASETQVGALGMIMVTDAAAAIGITAIPDPVTQLEDDGWFLYQSFAQSNVVLSGVGFSFNTGNWYPFDSKAKRIFSGEGVQFAVVVSNAHPTTGINVLLNFRTLTQVRGTR